MEFIVNFKQDYDCIQVLADHGAFGFKNEKRLRNRFLILLGSMLLLAVICCLFSFNELGAIVAAIALIWCLFICVRTPVMVKKANEVTLMKDYELIVREDGFAVINEDYTINYKWSFLDYIWEDKVFIILVTKDNRCVVLKKLLLNDYKLDYLRAKLIVN